MKYSFKNSSISTKIQIKITTVSLFVIAGLILINSFNLKKTAFLHAKDITESKANEFANINKSEFENAINKLKTNVASFQSFEKINANDRRAFFVQSLKNILDKNPEYIGIGIICEPIILDGLDSNFCNAPGCTKTGRFLPYLTRLTTDIDIQQSENFETVDWYTTSKSNLKVQMTEPLITSINNEDILTSTISMPIVSEGNFFGILYAIVSFEKLTKCNNQLRVLNSGYGQLITFEGTILTHPVKKYISQPLDEFKERKFEIIDAIIKGKCFSTIENNKKSNDKVLKVFAPVKIDELQNPLSFVIFVPYQEIMKTTKTYIYQSLFIGFLGLVLIIIASFFIAKSITNPIKKATQTINTIAITGRIDISKKIAISTKDDYGELANAINALCDELNTKTYFANEIKIGNLDSSYKPLSNEDILGNSLQEIKNSLIKSTEEEKIRKFEDDKRNWAAEGLAKFAEILRKNNDNIELLTYELIKNLVKYIKANQGGVFLFNDENNNEQYLELISCFAYDRQKYLKKKILIGEGLVGTCYLEKKSIFLTNIPKSYINISSGLGDSNPSSVLIVPIILNESNFGVIEMASFEKIEKYQIEFIEKVTEIIASTISSVQINTKTASLLSQSQEQAETMKAQEEEMRQNMEELTATQESLAEKDLFKQKEIEQLKSVIEENNILLKQKEEENLNTISSLNQELQKCLQNNLSNKEYPTHNSSFHLAEFIFNSIANVVLNLEMTVISFNEKFLGLINKSEAEVKGYKLSSIFKYINENTGISDNILSNIKNGQAYTENILYSSPYQDKLWLKVVFYPFINNNNYLENIIACFYEVTEDIQTKNSLINQLTNLTAQIESSRQQNNNVLQMEMNYNTRISDHVSIIELLSNAFIKEEYITDGQIVDVNNHFVESYGYQRSEIEGTNIISLIPEKLKKEFRMIWDSLMRGNTFKGETCRLSKSGNELWLTSVYLPIFDQTKKIEKIIFLAYDITESKKLETENQRQLEIIKKFENEMRKIKPQNENTKKLPIKKKPQ